MTISPTYRIPILRTFVAQALVSVIASLVLDGGTAFEVVGIAVAAYWGALVIIVLRHPLTPSRGDLLWARLGFAVSLALAAVVCPAVWWSRGWI